MVSACTCARTDGYRIKRRGCPAHTETDSAYWQQSDDRKHGTDSPHEPTDDFVRAAFAEGARHLWPDSRDPGWCVTFDRWLAGRAVEPTRESFALGAAWALGDDEEAPASLRSAIERARDVLDGWEHDGPDDPAIHLLIRRVRDALGAAVADDKGARWGICDMDCQPDWHHDECAIYIKPPLGGAR